MKKTYKKKTKRHNIKNNRKTRKKNNKSKHVFNKSKHVFNDEHYDSGEGMLTSVWGPSLWHFLHIISFNYPVNPTSTHKKKFKEFMNLLKHILPCKYCRINFKKNLKTLPLNKKVFESRDKFSRYMYDLHELVNKTLGKKSNLTYKDVRDRYEHFRARCGNKNKNKKGLTSTVKKIKHKGCTDPLHGKRSKCVLNIVPANKKCKTFNLDMKV